jgi:phosphatidylglycerophosphate synthase
MNTVSVTGGCYALKPWFGRALSPVSAELVRRQVAPATLTALAVGVTAAMGLALLAAPTRPGWLWLVAAGALVRLVLNALDGDVARRQGRASRWGEVQNEVGDRLGDALVFGALAVGPYGPAGWGVAALATALLTGFVGVVGQATVGYRPHHGPGGKPDRMLGLAVTAGAVALGAPWVAFALYLGAVVVLGAATVWLRLEAIRDRA